MAIQRVSKLQNWILDRAVSNLKSDFKEQKENCGRPYLYRQEIYYHFYGWTGDLRNVPQKYRVSVSRSLKKLEQQGMVSFLPPKKCFIYFTNKLCDALLKELNVNEDD